jgi:hypothetical protein
MLFTRLQHLRILLSVLAAATSNTLWLVVVALVVQPETKVAAAVAVAVFFKT